MQRKLEKQHGFKDPEAPYTFAVVNDKGQVVINKEVREWGNIKPGDKLLMYRSELNNSRKRVILVKVDDMLKETLADYTG